MSKDLEPDPQGILDAVVSIAGRLDMDGLLADLVAWAISLTGAAAGAIAVLDPRGMAAEYLAQGDDVRSRRAVEGLRDSPGVVGLMKADEVLLANNLRRRPAFPGFGVMHADVDSLLGASVRVRGMVFAHLYLVNKVGGFLESDAASVVALTASVGGAIDNAQQHEAARRRERWLRAGQEITTAMLSGVDEEEVLAMIAARAREVASADTCALVLPSLDDRLVLEIADGLEADQLVGTVMPLEGRSHTVLSEGIGMIVDSFSQAFTLRVPQLRAFNAALYAPMRTSGRGIGVMLLLRTEGRGGFDHDDLSMAEAFASQAAAVLVLAEARHAEDVRALLSERERIARDLHDLVVQQLFATGMRLDATRREVAGGPGGDALEAILASCIDNVDDSVRQIRSIVHGLRGPDAGVTLAERLRREASLARASLGFAPSLVILVGGRVLDGLDLAEEEHLDALVGAGSGSGSGVGTGTGTGSGTGLGSGSGSGLGAGSGTGLGDDVVAVAREGLANAARHAGASSVNVTVSVDEADGSSGGRITVEVVDDGVGLSEASGRRSGLKNLAARARKHKGKLSVRAREGEAGTRICWTVPVGKD